MIRIRKDTSIPVYFESAPLRGGLRSAGWIAGLLSVVLGFRAIASTESVGLEIVGTVLVVLGAALLVAVVQCKSFEATVGTKRIESGTGPFRQTVPSGSLESATSRPASAWRRLFAQHEVYLRSSVGSGEAVIPSRTPDALIDALRAYLQDDGS